MNLFECEDGHWMNAIRDVTSFMQETGWSAKMTKDTDPSATGWIMKIWYVMIRVNGVLHGLSPTQVHSVQSNHRMHFPFSSTLSDSDKFWVLTRSDLDPKKISRVRGT